VTGPRQRRAYRAVLRRIAVLKDRIPAALAAGDEGAAAAAHVDLLDLEQEARVMESRVRK
jgi:hypothetical protein